jgi:hypothetical protein
MLAWREGVNSDDRVEGDSMTCDDLKSTENGAVTRAEEVPTQGGDRGGTADSTADRVSPLAGLRWLGWPRG